MILVGLISMSARDVTDSRAKTLIKANLVSGFIFIMFYPVRAEMLCLAQARYADR